MATKPAKPLPYQEVIRREVRLQLDLPCTACGSTMSVAKLAGIIGVDGSTLWKFLHLRTRPTMLSKNLKALAEWLRMRGVKVPDPPPVEEEEEG